MISGLLIRPKKINLVFRATVLKTSGRVSSVYFKKNNLDMKPQLLRPQRKK